MRHLYAPGPIKTPNKIMSALLNPTPPYFGDEEFYNIMEKVQLDLQYTFFTKNPVLLLTGSGSLAMEQSVSNFFSPGSKILLINSGRYGENWKQCCLAYGLRIKELKAELSPIHARAVPIEDIEKFLKKHPDTEGVLVQHVETTTNVKNDVQAITKLVREHTEGIVVVDAVSSLLSERLEVGRWDLDVVLSASQKGLSLPPGLAMMVVNDRAKEFAKRSKFPKFYFNVLEEIERQIDKHQTRFTPAVNLILALSETLDWLTSPGYTPLSVIEKSDQAAKFVRSYLGKIGLTEYSLNPSNTLTLCLFPMANDNFFTRLKYNHNVILGKGQDHLKDKCFRIMHFGWDLDMVELGGVLWAIQDTVEEMIRNIKQ